MALAAVKGVRAWAVAVRAAVNRLRRALWRPFAFRMVFGERDPATGELRPHTRIAPSTCIEGQEALALGDHVFIGQFNFLEASGGLTLGGGVQITNFCSLVTHSSQRAQRLLGRAYVQWPGEKPGFKRAPIAIGPYAFIGPHALIEAGARVGKGALVCAYAQVRGEVPDFAIVAGQPAQVVGDVRTGDAPWLAQHPQCRAHYAQWSGELL